MLFLPIQSVGHSIYDLLVFTLLRFLILSSSGCMKKNTAFLVFIACSSILMVYFYSISVNFIGRQSNLIERKTQIKFTESEKATTIDNRSMLMDNVISLNNVTEYKTEINTTERRTSNFTETTQVTNSAVQYPKKQWYITTNIHSRLGNHMFSYAGLLGIASAQDRIPFLREGYDLSEHFHISHVNSNISTNGWLTIYQDKHTKFEEKFMNLPERDIAMIGCFQSWKYFQHVKDEVRREFTFSDTLQEQVTTILTPYRRRQKNNVLVGVHARRGDFLDKKNVEWGFGVPNATYFMKAFAKMRELIEKQNVTFLLASDDLQWCKDNLNDTDLALLPPGNPQLHMALLSSCDHVIISGGTYGWWSAWLANGITIYYSDYVMKGTGLETFYKKEDYYPPGWIGLEN